MAKNIKITMLGAKGVGKTCFMLGMYSVMRLGVNGFTFAARDASNDEDLDLELSRKWSKLKKEGPDRWPLPTDKRDFYPFDLRYGFSTKVMSFDWIDYPGGALESSPKDEDVVALKKHLRESSSIFLCVSGEYLKEGTPLDSIYDDAGVGRMMKFITQMRDENGSTVPPSVAIVITQFDKCAARAKGEIIKTIQDVFNPLFQKGTRWLVMICPVSLGTELAADPVYGAVSPKHVHLPVSFAVYTALKRDAESLGSQISSKQTVLSGFRNANFFKRWMNSDSIDQYTNEVAALRRQQAAIERDVQLLVSELVKGVTFYYESEEVDPE